MTFTIKEDDFYLDDKKVFLNSGEIHYFRIKRELWARHLEAAKEAGLTTVSSYVPWAWHESEESVFDFDGRLCPERDLIGWLKLCQDHGLHCILKPGPFILAEFRGAGLPDWFLDQFGEQAKMRNSNGEVVKSDGVSLFNQKYLEKTKLWYDNIMSLISKNEISAGGPVIMMQICNEIGVFSWLAKQADYGNKVKDHFIKYLSSKFNNINELNGLWNTNYKDFKSVELPPDGSLPYVSQADRGRDYEWHCFWRRYYGDYLRMLTGMARSKGITVPLYHNLPGWIYASGYEFPVNITMYDDLFGDKSEIIFGVDHIPEFLSYRNMHDDRIINDITAAMQGKKPLFAAEFQCGSREYHVVTNPREMELFYKSSLINGLKGWNYYMFSQGRNPRHKGYSGETFYWFNPLTPEGEKTSTFPLVKRMSKLVHSLENLILTAKRKAEVCVLFYPPYYATELERPISPECELQFIPSAIRRPAFFDGLLKVLQLLNIDYDMMDLSSTDAAALSKYKQAWLFSTDEMNSGDQQTLVDYVKLGGNAVLFPYLPDRDMSQRPCSVIRQALSISPAGIENIDSPLIDTFGLKDIKCANPQIIYHEEDLAGAEIIARTLQGNVCGFIKAVGNGQIIHLGTWIGFDTEGQIPVYETILKRSGATLRQAWTNNFQINARERFTNADSGVLFAGNYYNEEQNGIISYTHPETGEILTIPYTKDEILWPPLYGIISPLCHEISEGLKILHTTSDILGVTEKNGEFEIIIYGERDLAGEIVFEGKNVHLINSATISGETVKISAVEKRIFIQYKHKHKEEMILNLKTN